MSRWFRDWTPAIQAGAAVVIGALSYFLVVHTKHYVQETASMVREMRRQRERERRLESSRAAAVLVEALISLDMTLSHQTEIVPKMVSHQDPCEVVTRSWPTFKTAWYRQGPDLLDDSLRDELDEVGTALFNEQLRCSQGVSIEPDAVRRLRAMGARLLDRLNEHRKLWSRDHTTDGT